MSELVNQYLVELRSALDRLPVQALNACAETLHAARLEGRRIFIMGNGGSAATASHFVCDLAKNTRMEGISDFKAIGLADNMPIFSAFGNDEGYENVFAGQLASLVEPGDVVIAISGSGNSANVLRAVELANRVGAYTIGFSGFDGGKLGRLVMLNVNVPSDCIQQVEDIHLVLEHILIGELQALALQTAPQMQSSAD